ncbi:hypothetical protein [Streptomyces mirabilis]
MGTVYGPFWRWNRAGVITYIRDQLRRRIRTGKGRCPHPVTLIVGSRSVKGTSTGSRGYIGDLVDWARERLWFTLRIVSLPKGAKGFVVLPRRWKVARTIGWCMNARRNARDYERLPQHSEAHLNWALIAMMTRRLTRRPVPLIPPSADVLREPVSCGLVLLLYVVLAEVGGPGELLLVTAFRADQVRQVVRRRLDC